MLLCAIMISYSKSPGHLLEDSYEEHCRKRYFRAGESPRIES